MSSWRTCWLVFFRNVKICILVNIYYIINRFVTNSHTFFFTFFSLVLFSFLCMNMFQTWRSYLGGDQGVDRKHLLLMHFPSKNPENRNFDPKNNISVERSATKWRIHLYSSERKKVIPKGITKPRFDQTKPWKGKRLAINRKCTVFKKPQNTNASHK